MDRWEAERLIERLREQTKKDTVSKEAALASLVRGGFVTPEGKLRPEYGGNSL